MVLWHVSLLPLVVGVIVGIHLLLVRRRGVVPPIGAEAPQQALSRSEADKAPDAAGATPGVRS